MKCALVLLMSVIVVSCNMKRDIARGVGLDGLVGKAIKTKVSLDLYEIDSQIYGYKDRYNLGINLESFPIACKLPPGYPVYIERVVRLFGPNLSSDYLEGCLEYKNKQYPFTFNVGFSGDSKESYTEEVNRYFIIPKAVAPSP